MSFLRSPGPEWISMRSTRRVTRRSCTRRRSTSGIQRRSRRSSRPARTEPSGTDRAGRRFSRRSASAIRSSPPRSDTSYGFGIRKPLTFRVTTRGATIQMTQQSNNSPVVPRLLSAPLVITRLFKSRFPLFFIFVLLFVAAPPALAQTAEDDDAVLQPAEPDYRVVNLPTTLRLPRYKSNFELTHRFNGNLRRGDFGDQASSLFGIDQGATIGFEYRFAPVRHVEVAVYRENYDKTIQMY